MILREAIVLVIAGLAIGLAGAIAGGRVLQNVLFEVKPGDPVLLAVACCTITLTSLAAAYLPAIRAASVDPLHALRAE